MIITCVFWWGFLVASFVYAIMVKLKRLATLERRAYGRKEACPVSPFSSGLLYLEERLLQDQSEYHACLLEMRRRFHDVFQVLALPQPRDLRKMFPGSASMTSTVWAPDFCMVFNMMQKNSPPQMHLGGVSMSNNHVVLDTMYQFDVPEHYTHEEKKCAAQRLLDCRPPPHREMHACLMDATIDVFQNRVIARVKLTWPLGSDGHVMAFVRKTSRTMETWKRVIERAITWVGKDIEAWQGWQNLGIKLKHHFLTISAEYKDGHARMIRLDDFNDWVDGTWGGVVLSNLDSPSEQIAIDCHVFARTVEVPPCLSQPMAQFVLWSLLVLFGNEKRFNMLGRHLRVLWPYLEAQPDVQWFITHEDVGYTLIDTIDTQNNSIVDDPGSLNDTDTYTLRYIVGASNSTP